MTLAAAAEVTYQTVPLPQQIAIDPSGKQALLIKGQAVTYPAGNDKMKSTAALAGEYLSLTPQVAGKKAVPGVQLSLGLKSENPRHTSSPWTRRASASRAQARAECSMACRHCARA